MICAIPFHHGDKNQAVKLANWIREIAGVSAHDCLLVIDNSTTVDGVIEPLREAFRSVSVVSAGNVPSPGLWGTGSTDASACNEMFLTAAWNIHHTHKRRWFLLEPDAVPLRSTWLDEIEAEDAAAAKPFMGACVEFPGIEMHMSGVAVYPASVCDYNRKMMQPGSVAWDYAGRADSIKHAHWTNLIQHTYRINGQKPTFPDAASLALIEPAACVFHPSKDGTLIDRLRERRKPIVNVVEAAVRADVISVMQQDDRTELPTVTFERPLPKAAKPKRKKPIKKRAPMRPELRPAMEARMAALRARKAA